MAQGLPYDSDDGRAWAAAITALMTGHAYATSARTAARMGSVRRLPRRHVTPCSNVLRMHRAEVAKIDEELVPPDLLSAAQEAWDTAVELGEQLRRAQLPGERAGPDRHDRPAAWTATPPGIEPDLGLVKTKKLVGGGTMSIVNQTVPAGPLQARVLARAGRGHRRLHRRAQVDRRCPAPDARSTCPCSPARWATTPSTTSGHIRMMGAVQPFISGAISKTVNMPEDVDRRGRRAAPPRCLAAGSQGGGHLPGQLQGGPAAVDHQEGGVRRRMAETSPRRAPRPRPTTGSSRRGSPSSRRRWPPSRTGPDTVVVGAVRERLPRRRKSEHLHVPGGRLRGLRDGRRVRRRPPRRGLHEGVQAGLDPGRDHGRLLDLGQPGPAARRAVGDVRPQVHATCDSSRPGSPTIPTSASRRAWSTTSSDGWPSTT